MIKEKHKLYMRTWRENHKEEYKLYQKIYCEKHKEEKKLYMKNYNKKYYEKRKENKKLYNEIYRDEHRDLVNKLQRNRMDRTSYAPKHKSKWTSEEELYIKTNAPYKTAYEIAIELRRSEMAVQMKAIRLGVSLNK